MLCPAPLTVWIDNALHGQDDMTVQVCLAFRDEGVPVELITPNFDYFRQALRNSYKNYHMRKGMLPAG